MPSVKNNLNDEAGRAGSRTGCQPVWDVGNALAARSTARYTPTLSSTPFLHEFPDAMATADGHFYSPYEETAVHRRNLPHWAKDSTLVFVTYRLADSMPAAKLREWQEERDAWLRLHPEPWDEATAREYYGTFPAKLDAMLDAGYGSCVLAREDCRRIVVENLNHFNGERYNLHSFVVMPNHVHVLMELVCREDLPKVLHSWKSYTANRINEATGGGGGVWQKEYYDRLIRDMAHYVNTVEYIRKNARMAEKINALAARCTSRTGCQPVQTTVANALAARPTACSTQLKGMNP